MKDCTDHYSLVRRSIAVGMVLFLVITNGALGQLPKLPALKFGNAKSGGTSSRKQKKNALNAIPYATLTPNAASRIQEVVNSPSIYRKLPTKTIDCDPKLFVFLVRNPEVVVDVWQQMGVTQLTVDRVGEFNFRSSDGAGTDSQIDLLYGTPNLHVYHGTGVYEGPLFKQKIRGQCVILLRTDFQAAEGRQKVRTRLDVFLKLDTGVADAVAKTISPLFGRSADVNFVETCGFLEKLSLAAEQHGPRMQGLAARMRTVSPPVKQRFVSVASTVADRTQGTAATTRVARPPSDYSAHSIRPASGTQSSGVRRPILDSRVESSVLR